MKILVILALTVCGWALLGVSGSQGELTVATHIVKQGETLDGISAVWFDKDVRRNKNWDEFRTATMTVNRKLSNRGRSLQPGDIVHIVYYAEVEQ